MILTLKDFNVDTMSQQYTISVMIIDKETFEFVPTNFIETDEASAPTFIIKKISETG